MLCLGFTGKLLVKSCELGYLQNFALDALVAEIFAMLVDGNMYFPHQFPLSAKISRWSKNTHIQTRSRYFVILYVKIYIISIRASIDPFKMGENGNLSTKCPFSLSSHNSHSHIPPPPGSWHSTCHPRPRPPHPYWRSKMKMQASKRRPNKIMFCNGTTCVGIC